MQNSKSNHGPRIELEKNINHKTEKTVFKDPKQRWCQQTPLKFIQRKYLTQALVNLMMPLVPFETACLASSPGRATLALLIMMLKARTAKSLYVHNKVFVAKINNILEATRYLLQK